MPGYYKHVVWTNIVSESSPKSIKHLMIHNFSVTLAAIDSVHRLLEVGPHYGNRHQPIIWAGMTSTSKLLHCEKLNKDASRACVMPYFVHYLYAVQRLLTAGSSYKTPLYDVTSFDLGRYVGKVEDIV